MKCNKTLTKKERVGGKRKEISQFLMIKSNKETDLNNR